MSTKPSSVVHMPSRLEVTVHTAYEEYPMSPTNQCALHLSSDAQLTDKPHELSFDESVEVREGKKLSAFVDAR